MRKPSACGACRARRRKCIYPAGRHATVCEYCLSHGLQCLQGPPEGGYYAKRRARLQEMEIRASSGDSPTQIEIPPSHNHDALPSLTVRRELVELYFEYIHDQFHSLYHRPSFMEDVENDRVSPIILFAIFALSARFSSNKIYGNGDPRERGEVYRVSGEKLLRIRDTSPTTIQACILLGAYAAANGETDVENLYYGLAGRMSLALDLPNQLADSSVQREMNIRTWWTICMVDVWSSTAVKLPRILPIENHVPLPVDEVVFSSMSTGAEKNAAADTVVIATPLLAEMVKLNRILSKIIDFNQACVSQQLEGMQLQQSMSKLSNELDNWLQELPEHMQDTPANFEYFASLGLGRMFVAVYLGYYHYGQLLNYQFLSSSSDSSGGPSAYADGCKNHAKRLCSLVYRSHATPGSEVLYSAVAHILVIASTVQIHTLLFSGEEDQIRVSKSRLERNFEILLKMRTYWPSVDSAMSRLRAFHQTCLRSRDTSFVLDRWLLRFLVEFAPHMELEPRDNDPDYEALLALSKRSPLSCFSGLSV